MKKRKTLQPNLSLNKMCSAFNKSKQVFYKRERTVLKRNTEETDKILDKVKYIKKKLPMLGGRKLKYMLARRKIHVGRDYLFDILRRHRMLVRRKRKYARTAMKINSTLAKTTATSFTTRCISASLNPNVAHSRR